MRCNQVEETNKHPGKQAEILALSGRSPDELSKTLLAWLDRGNIPQVSPRSEGYRLALVADNQEALRVQAAKVSATLRAGEPISIPDVFFSSPQTGKVAWLFPGQGSQYPGMLQGLRKVWPAFDRHFRSLEADWSQRLGASILSWIDVPDDTESRNALQDTRHAQLALGLCEIALCRAWQDLGLKTDCLAGHSYGELPALAMAGAMDDGTLFNLTRMRGELLGEAGDAAPGGMLAVKAGRDAVARRISHLAGQIFIANENAPEQTVLAGTHAGLSKAAALFQEAGIASTVLRTAAAFHTPMMAPVAERWTSFLATQELQTIESGKVYSNVSGAAYCGNAPAISASLARQLVSSVRWRDEIEALYADGCRLFIEIGPGQTLTDLTGRILGERTHQRIASDPCRRAPHEHFVSLLAQLWVWGLDLDLSDYATPVMQIKETVSPEMPAMPDRPDDSPSIPRTETNVSAMTFESPAAGAAPVPDPSAQLSPEGAFFQANQQAVHDFFQQQQNLVAAVEGKIEPALFSQMVDANQSVLQEFLATQQAAMQAMPFTLDAMPHLAPTPGLPARAHIAAATNGAAPPPVAAVDEPQPASSAASAVCASAGANHITQAAQHDDDVEQWLAHKVAELTGLPLERIKRDTQFESELGLDSITLVELWVDLAKAFPQLNGDTVSVNGVACIGDILAHLPANATSSGTEKTAPVVARSAPGEDVETWLLNQIAQLTGLPIDRLHRDQQFEADLGIDSITMVELWLSLVEKFPQFGQYSDGATTVRSVADVLRLAEAKAPSEPTDPCAASRIDSTLALAKTVSDDWLTCLRSRIVARIADERGIEAESITGTSDFAHELGLDIFTRERILEEEVCSEPSLAFVGRELLNVACLDELSGLLARFCDPVSGMPQNVRNAEPQVSDDDHAEPVLRFTLVGEPPAPSSELGNLPDRVLLIGEAGTTHAGLNAGFASCGVAVDALHFDAKGWRHPGTGRTAALDDVAAIGKLLEGIANADGGKLPAMIYLGMSARTPGNWRDQLEQAGVGLFAFVKAAHPCIKAMGREAAFGVLTRSDDPAWAAACGIAKTLALELPDARVRAARMCDDIAELAPEMILKVLSWGPSAHDLHLVKDGVIRQVLVRQPINQDIIRTRHRHPRLNPGSMILLTGGAAGITAEASVMLADKYHAHIAAIGRTPMPEEYPYPGITDDAELKRILFKELEDAAAGKTYSQDQGRKEPGKPDDKLTDPAALRRRHAAIRRQREIWNTRRRVLEAGGKFSYYQADATDSSALDKVLARIRAESGPLHGVIHGAGMTDDHLIGKKSIEEFRRVYYAKALSTFNLMQCVKDDALEFAFLFSSLASYTGTPGQADYVAANELINAVAKSWNRRVSYPVRSLLWSVWSETGLAAGATERQMRRLGLGGISNEQGIRLLHDELVAGNKFDDWVLLSPQSTLEYTAAGSAADSRTAELIA
ncbi:hypothetical protein BH11PSE11_BH11PSE11_07530 [soil metagenome]